MSYILDALKKKETESNGAVPDIKSQHYHSEFDEESKSHWKYIIVALGILFLLALLITAYNYGKQVETSDKEAVPMGSNKNQVTNAEILDNQQKAESTNKEVTKDDTQDNRSQLEVSTKPIELKKPVVQKVVLPKPKPKPVAVTVTVEPKQEPLSSVAEVATAQINQTAPTNTESSSVSVSDDLSALPAIRYTSHVYADEPKDRFVMLNGRALGIGQKLPNGVRVEDIYEDDLLISYQGKTYQIPSLTDINQ